MLSRATTRCLRLFLFIFLMCPKRVRLGVPIGNQPEYYHAVRRSSNVKFSDSLIPTFHENQQLKGDVSFREDEPGLELTDEEILKFKLWDRGVVPYYIDVVSFADKVLRDKIRSFLNGVNSLTPLNFVELPRPPKDDETRWVFFVNRRALLGCADHSATNLTTSGVQPVTLGYDCMTTGGELAEAVLEIAGVPPQHNSPDRDDYIEVLADNIMPEKRHLFQILSEDNWPFLDSISYDLDSAGHFHNHKHSANGQATIKIKNGTKSLASEKSNTFSSIDIRKIKMLYNSISKSKKEQKKIFQCSQLYSRPPRRTKNKGSSDNRPNKYSADKKKKLSGVNKKWGQ